MENLNILKLVLDQMVMVKRLVYGKMSVDMDTKEINVKRIILLKKKNTQKQI